MYLDLIGVARKPDSTTKMKLCNKYQLNLERSGSKEKFFYLLEKLLISFGEGELFISGKCFPECAHYQNSDRFS
jgi:hypothetical protein